LKERCWANPATAQTSNPGLVSTRLLLPAAATRSVGRRLRARAATPFLALAVALTVLAACGGSTPVVETLPRPSSGPASVVPGQPPVVWISGQSADVSGSRLTVVGWGGARTVVRRLSRGATKFFVLHEGRFERMVEDDALLIEVGTPMCVESLLDGRSLIALRVFVGAACGPRP
jgi:hypothetical protein